jgi:RHS repeat-associated protein
MCKTSNKTATANTFIAFAVAVFWFCISSLAFANIPYDALNRVDKITAPDNSETKLDYDANGNRTKITRANGTTSEYTYNAANQRTSVVHKKADNTALASFQYILDKNGRKTKATETVNGQTRTIDYTYDETGKLTQEKAQEGIRITTTDYRYDNVGNRTKKTVNGIETTYVYNVNDQLTSKTTGTQTTTYTYDNNGNLVAKQTPAGTVTYTWNSDNKLTGVNDQPKGTTVTYRLDAEGKRIGKTLQQGATRTEQQYLIDPARPYSEIVQSWTRVGTGAWGNDTVYLMTPDGIGDLIAQTTGADTTFILQDGQGSSRITTDASGDIVGIITYDAFGNRIDGFGHSATDATNLNHLYVGEHYDADSGFYHLRARDYDPVAGRFTARGAFEGVKAEILSLNQYIYAHADPINNIDPSGYFSLGGMMSGLGSMATLEVRVVVIGGRTAVSAIERRCHTRGSLAGR